MNKITLTFHDQNLEEEYKKQQNTQDVLKSKKYLNMGYVVMITYAVTDIYYQKYQSLINSLIVIVGLFILQRYIEKLTIKCFSTITFVLNLFFASVFPLSDFLDIQLTYDTYSKYYMGQVFCMLLVSLNVGSYFILKILLIFINALIQYMLICYKTQSFFPLSRINLITTAILLIMQMYLDETYSREKFLLKKEQIQWERNLDDFQEITVAKCRFNESKYTFELLQSENYQKQKSKIFKTDQFCHFIRNTELFTIIECYDYSKLKRNKVNLEQFLFHLHRKEHYKNFDQPDILYSVQGQFQENIFQIKIYLSYNIEPFFVMMFKEKENQTKQKLSYYQEIAKKVVKNIDQISSSFHYFRLSGYLKPKNKVEMLGECKKYLFLQRLRNYNYFVNPQNIEIEGKKFYLNEAIQNIVNILQVKANKKNIKIFLLDTLQQQVRIKQDLQKLSLIIFNLLMNSINYSQQGSSILIDIKFQKISQFHYKGLKISIYDSGPTILEKQLRVLPIINPCFFDQIAHNKQHKLQLGLAISTYLLKFIGLEDQITITSYQNQKKISFKILSDLGMFGQNKMLNSLSYDPRYQIQLKEKNPPKLNEVEFREVSDLVSFQKDIEISNKLIQI